jgi:uncharacterized repeat protein (TIGR01451 family)
MRSQVSTRRLDVVRRALNLIPLLVLVSSVALAVDGPLTGNIEALKVVTKESGEEIFLPADEANPSDIIEYRLTYANDGDAALRNVSVTDPVPFGTEYVVETATAEGVVVAFSIDNGKTYHSWPVRVKTTDENGNEVTVDATPDMVTHIRWTIDGELLPESEITFSYRARIK